MSPVPNKIPAWIMNEYIKLRAIFSEKPFTVEEAAKVLERDIDTVITLLNRLKQHNMVEVPIHPNNPKKKDLFFTLYTSNSRRS